MSVAILDDIDGDLNAIVALDDSDDVEDGVFGFGEEQLLVRPPRRKPTHLRARADADYFEHNWRARPTPSIAVDSVSPESAPPAGPICSARLP